MKNKIIFSIVIVFTLTVIGGVMIIIFHSDKHPSIREFDVAKYQWEIENFSFQKNVGQVNDVNTVIEKAKELWIEKYGTVNGQPYDPIKGRGIEALFDKNNDCWLVKIALLPDTKGSTPHAIIQKDGMVLAVWMG